MNERPRSGAGDAGGTRRSSYRGRYSLPVKAYFNAFVAAKCALGGEEDLNRQGNFTRSQRSPSE